MSLFLPAVVLRAALRPLAEASAFALPGSRSGSEQIASVTALCLIVLYALLLVFAYYAPLINEYINHRKDSSRPKHLSWPFGVRSFAGGMAAAYVFILLIPEM